MSSDDGHLRTFHFSEFSPQGVADRKAGQLVSVCIPARNEAATVGPIVASIQRQLVDEIGLVDEIIVVDDHSEDATAEQAAAAGATVIDAGRAVPGFSDGPGKGQAMWASLYASRGDIVVWCDADVANFGIHFISGLVGPMVADPDLGFVKGFYQRPVAGGERGGRVTELVARPLLALLFPELQAFNQPLSGEYTGRRKMLEHVGFERDYGVEVGLLIDLWKTRGLASLAQVDLGSRIHRNHPTYKLSAQAVQVLHAALTRADQELVRDDAVLERLEHGPVELHFGTRPPVATVPGYDGG